MTPVNIDHPLSIFANPKPWMTAIKSEFPFLHYAALIQFIGIFISLTAIFISDQEITGINAWIKPTKFLISSVIFLWTIGWYLLFYPFHRISKQVIALTLSVVLLIENAVIITQAYRGVKSHFNISTAFDIQLWQIMGIAIAVLSLIMFWFFFKSFSPKLNFPWDKKWAFRIAWLTLIISAFAGNMMATQGSHSIGVPDGGDGLPFLNWSTKGGDLRAAHFFGLHAIQIVPLFIFWAESRRISLSLQRILNISFALLFLALVSATFLLAKAGIPLINL